MNRIHRMGWGVGWFLVLMVGGCTALRERMAVRNLRIAFSRAEVVRLDLAGATLRLSFEAYNPNTVRAVMDGFSFTLEANDHTLASGETQDAIRIPPGKRRAFDVIVFVPWRGLSSAVVQTLRDRSARLRVEGVAHVQTPLGRLRFRVMEYAREFR